MTIKNNTQNQGGDLIYDRQSPDGAGASSKRSDNNPAPQSPQKKRVMTMASFCAMTCSEGAFHKFLHEYYSEPCTGKDDAASFVYRYCGIESRRELNTNEDAARKWRDVKAAYDLWLKE